MTRIDPRTDFNDLDDTFDAFEKIPRAGGPNEEQEHHKDSRRAPSSNRKTALRNKMRQRGYGDYDY